eukprot:89339-Prymnesium_polylepis.1
MSIDCQKSRDGLVVPEPCSSGVVAAAAPTSSQPASIFVLPVWLSVGCCRRGRATHTARCADEIVVPTRARLCNVAAENWRGQQEMLTTSA